MDVLRRNTDYALRAMVHLAKQWKQRPASSRDISAAEGVSYDLMCKLLQKLAKNRLVKSTMGPKGGFELCRAPDKITIAQVIKSAQGPINLNRCLLGNYKCPRKGNCPVYEKIAELQKYIDKYFGQMTLADLIKNNGKRTKRKGKK